MIERQGKLGLGTAYLAGFRWALENGYRYIFEMDADFSHNPDDLIKLYQACADEGADLAIGSRYISGINVINWPLEASVNVIFRVQIRQNSHRNEDHGHDCRIQMLQKHCP